MKIPRLFNSVRAFTCLRVLVAGSCVLAAAALAFVATANNNSSDPISKNRILQPTAQDGLNIASEAYGKDAARKEEPSELESGPTPAAMADYLHPAHPPPVQIALSGLLNA